MSNRNAGPHADSDTGIEPSDNEGAMQELRSLLLGREQQELRALRERMDNLKVRAQETSEVVTEALRLRDSSDHTHQISEVLLPAVERALRESVRKDPTILAEALYPVMGPAIRKSIFESIRALIQSFNLALTQGLSIRGIKWRIEAMRTGRPFAEVVLLHTLVFRVEQVFLIHKKSGLLLHHLAMPQMEIQDPDMVSGMLSAIRDFVHDSFNSPQGTSVNTLQVGDLQVWVEQSPQAYLAGVIRGHAPQRLRFKLKEHLEKVHQMFSRELESFNGDIYPFLPATEILKNCFESHLSEEKPFRPRPIVSVLGAIAAISMLVWIIFLVIQGRVWSRYIETLRHQPGIAVNSYFKSGGRYHIQGMRDPLSSDPAILAALAGVDPSRIVFEWSAYNSSDDALVLKRATAFLKPPKRVSLSVRDGTLLVKGESEEDWASMVRTLGPLISGVRLVESAGLTDLGALSFEKKTLQSAIVLFATGLEEISNDQKVKLPQVAEAIHRLLAKAQVLKHPVVVEIIGHTDSTGTEAANSLLSQQRAQNVLQALLQYGIPAASLRSRAVSTSEPIREEKTEDDRTYNRSVTFRVQMPGSANER